MTYGKRLGIQFASFLKSNKAWIILGLVAAIINLIIVLIQFRSGIQFGDGATFYQFARYISSGEVFLQDFIHFRTPGSYFMYSLFVAGLGDTFSSINFALLFESRVLYATLFIVALAILFNKKFFWLSTLAVVLVMLLPEYAQIRTVLAFLSVALLVRYFVHASRAKPIKLIYPGIFVGLSFTFGQEMGIIAAVLAIILVAVFGWKNRTGRYRLLREYGWLIGGGTIGIAPILIYVIINGQLYNAFYYFFYYALLKQPQYMDLPFPDLSYSTILYYLPFVITITSINLIHSLRQSKDRSMLVILLSFVILRMVTLLGRTDMGHLIFMLPEMIVLIIVTLDVWLREKPKFSITQNLILSNIAVAALFIMVINGASSMLLIMPATIPLLLFFAPLKDRVVARYDGSYLMIVYVALASIFIFLLTPTFISEAKSVTSSLKDSSKKQLEGSYVDDASYELVSKVTEAVKQKKPDTIFAFPIQPYFYRLAKNHATSFLTYEPQTTIKEQERSIRELIERRPQVVIFDPAQASDLADSLWLINKFVLSNYKIDMVVNESRIIWIMVPRQNTQEEVPVVFNKGFSKSKIQDVQSPDKNIHNGVMTTGEQVIYPEGSYKVLSLEYVKEDSTGCSQIVVVDIQGRSESKDVCRGGLVRVQAKVAIRSIEFKTEVTKTATFKSVMLNK